MGPRPHLEFCPCKSAWLAPETLVSKGPRHNLSFCACKTAWLAPDLLVSMGPSPHLWFLHSKQRLLDQCTSLYGCQTSPVVWCMQTATLGPDLHVCMGPRPHLWFWAHITLCLAQESIDYIGYSPHLCVFFHAKQRLYDQTYKSVWVPDLICGFEHT